MNKNDKISQDMYHRVFRMARRSSDPRLIAAGLGLPVEIVKGILARLNSTTPIVPAGDLAKKVSEAKAELDLKNAKDPYLDIYVFTKTRFVEVDFSGTFIEQCKEHFDKEVAKILASDWKLVALRMTEVLLVDDCCMKALQKYYEDFIKRGRFTAILDPSSAVEEYLASNRHMAIPVFGTVAAFEERGLSTGRQAGKK